jgi:hypothetical protein
VAVRDFKISSFCTFELDLDDRQYSQLTIFFNNYCTCRFHVVREFREQVSNYEPFKQDSVILSLPKFQQLLSAIKKEEEKATLNRELDQ